MSDKGFVAYGVTSKEYQSAHHAAMETYTLKDETLISTPLIFPENPFNDQVKNAKVILDLGCGVGRNLSWIMENTDATYIGLDPNPTMLKYFFEVNASYKDNPRVKIAASFEELAELLRGYVIDVVVCTFVFQHIGFRPPAGQMNVVDITQRVREWTTKNTLWIMYEHDFEEPWIGPWEDALDITFDVYIRAFDYPLLTDRGRHHLLIWHG